MAKTKDKKYKTYIIWRGSSPPKRLVDIFWCEFDADLPCNVNTPNLAGDYWLVVREYYGHVLGVNNWGDMLITGAGNAYKDLRAHGITP